MTIITGNNNNSKLIKGYNKVIIKGFWILLWLCSPHLLLTKVIKTIIVTKKIVNIIKGINHNQNNNENRIKNKNNLYKGNL